MSHSTTGISGSAFHEFYGFAFQEGSKEVLLFGKPCAIQTHRTVLVLQELTRAEGEMLPLRLLRTRVNKQLEKEGLTPIKNDGLASTLIVNARNEILSHFVRHFGCFAPAFRDVPARILNYVPGKGYELSREPLQQMAAYLHYPLSFRIISSSWSRSL
jgi:hypothetical protein